MLPESTTCAIAGGGPAGMMLGYLLARRGIDVVVLEKHADFFRDFRGDTVHPSTLDALETLGLLDEFLPLAKNRQRALGVRIGSDMFPGPDLRFITAHNKFLVIVPQWDFLNFLAERAKSYSAFRLELDAEVVDVVRDAERVTGVRVRTEDGTERTLAAGLVVACDGRRSTVRERSGLSVRDLGAPIDVLWFRVDRRADDPPDTFGSIQPGHFMVLIDREDYWQCAYVIGKGALPALRARGLAAFLGDVHGAAPFLGDRIDALAWDDFKLLGVAVDRLERWAQPGLLCIGDAAHAMSPVGGVGINLAVQDAIATSNLLAPALERGTVTLEALEAVQRRREFPTKVTQAFQLFVHRNFLRGVLEGRGEASLAGAKRAVRLFGFMRYLLAQFIGVGVRPELPIV